jgi:hypothetical protein
MSRDHPGQLVVDRLEQRATELHEAAQTLPPGDEREGILHRARRMEAASNVISRWYPRSAQGHMRQGHLMRVRSSDASHYVTTPLGNG